MIGCILQGQNIMSTKVDIFEVLDYKGILSPASAIVCIIYACSQFQFRFLVSLIVVSALKLTKILIGMSMLKRFVIKER